MGSQGNGNYQEKQEFQGWCDTMPQLCSQQVPTKDHPSLLAQHPVTYDPEWPLTSWWQSTILMWNLEIVVCVIFQTGSSAILHIILSLVSWVLWSLEIHPSCFRGPSIMLRGPGKGWWREGQGLLVAISTNWPPGKVTLQLWAGIWPQPCERLWTGTNQTNGYPAGQ